MLRLRVQIIEWPEVKKIRVLGLTLGVEGVEDVSRVEGVERKAGFLKLG
ncbi:MAG: hypothetical protein R3351_08860 [Nitrospirales bacterium]|nr:hypothetical protein [Nitrospirales bacterium]